MTAPDFAPLAAALHTRQDLTVAVIAVLATRAVSDGLSAYEVLDAVRYAADEIDADDPTQGEDGAADEMSPGDFGID